MIGSVPYLPLSRLTELSPSRARSLYVDCIFDFLTGAGTRGFPCPDPGRPSQDGRRPVERCPLGTETGPGEAPGNRRPTAASSREGPRPGSRPVSSRPREVDTGSQAWPPLPPSPCCPSQPPGLPACSRSPPRPAGGPAQPSAWPTPHAAHPDPHVQHTRGSSQQSRAPWGPARIHVGAGVRGPSACPLPDRPPPEHLHSTGPHQPPPHGCLRPTGCPARNAI